MTDYTDLEVVALGLYGQVPCEAGADTIDPVVTVVSPAAGSTIGKYTEITFDVTDETGLREVIVWAEIAGYWEVIFGGADEGFAPGYTTSTRSTITGGYRFVVQRAGGWTASPTFHARPFDTGGNTA